MNDLTKARGYRRLQLTRRTAIFLMHLGVTSEMVAIAGMVLGILAGVAFMATGESASSNFFWGFGGALCLLRIAFIRLDRALEPASLRQSREEEFYNELPERVSDAVTLIGFGFAVHSSPWLGLAAALSAIFSAYIRTMAASRPGGRKVGSAGIMRRRDRLFLLAGASILMILDLPGLRIELPLTLPHLVLHTIIVGCLLTVLLRWLALRAIKV